MHEHLQASEAYDKYNRLKVFPSYDRVHWSPNKGCEKVHKCIYNSKNEKDYPVRILKSPSVKPKFCLGQDARNYMCPNYVKIICKILLRHINFWEKEHPEN